MNTGYLRHCYGTGAGKILLSIPVRRRAGALAGPARRRDLPGAGLAALAMVFVMALALGERTPGVLAVSDLAIVLLEDVAEVSARLSPRPAPRAAPAAPPVRAALRREPRPRARAPIQIDGLRRPARSVGSSRVSGRGAAVQAAAAAPAPAAPGFDLPVETMPAARARISVRDRLVRGSGARVGMAAAARISPGALGLPGLGMPAVSAAAPGGPGPAAVSAAPPGRGDRDAEPDAALRGVPLGALASCRSDRREDRLKQRLIAAARSDKQCASRAGTYRFVETRNLNAFLMWVERNPARVEVDRCAELELALACLAGSALGEVETP